MNENLTQEQIYELSTWLKEEFEVSPEGSDPWLRLALAVAENSFVKSKLKIPVVRILSVEELASLLDKSGNDWMNTYNETPGEPDYECELALFQAKAIHASVNLNYRIIEEVLTELSRAVKKFPTWPTDPLHAVAVIGEEFGELTQAVLQSVYEPEKSSPTDVHKEVIQVAAMALRFLMSHEQYVYQPGEQHAQDSTITTNKRKL